MTEKPSEQRLQTLCLAVIATAVATYMVYWLRPVLVPFVVALLVVSGVTPLLELTERTLRVNRLVASALAFVTGLVVLGVLCLCLWISVLQIREKGAAYSERVGELVASGQRWVERTTSAAFRSLPVSEEAEVGDQENRQLGPDELGSDSDQPDGGPALGTDRNEQDATAKSAVGYLSGLRAGTDVLIREGLARLSAELFGILSTSVVVLIYVFFILLGSAERPASLASVRAVDHQVRTYLSLKTVISIFTGVFFGGALWLFGVPMSLTFGLLAFLLNYIPNIGPIVASLLPIPFILLAPEGSIAWMVAAICVTMAIQVVSGSVIEPKLMGDSSDLHPVVILLALMFWGMMWGITGMFLATPITAGIKIVLESNQATKPIAAILAGRWDALSAAPQAAKS